MEKLAGQAEAFIGSKDSRKGGNVVKREMTHCRKRPGRRPGLEGFLY
jgi:hypothetical protein